MISEIIGFYCQVTVKFPFRCKLKRVELTSHAYFESDIKCFNATVIAFEIGAEGAEPANSTRQQALRHTRTMQGNRKLMSVIRLLGNRPIIRPDDEPMSRSAGLGLAAGKIMRPWSWREGGPDPSAAPGLRPN